MIQLVPRVQKSVSFAAATTRWPVMGVNSIPVNNDGWYRFPLPWATTIRNLVLISNDDTRPEDITVTLMKNNATTALEVDLLASENGPVKDIVDEVSFAQLDDCDLRFLADGPSSNPGNVFGWCLELESQGNVFGVPIHALGSCPVGQGGIAGALGNGYWESYVHASPPTKCTSYSICAVKGTLTTLVMKTLATPPGVGAAWASYLRKNSVTQDGTGGTVNTRCAITAGNTTGVATFSLPIDIADIIEVVYVREGSDHVFEVAGQVGVGIGFVPDTLGQFMVTGGSNSTLGSPGYVWPLSGDGQSDETLAVAPIGPGGFAVRGMYLEGPSPGVNPTDEVTNILRKNYANTSISVSRQFLEQSTFIQNQSVIYEEDDVITLANLVTGGTIVDSSRAYWGLAASVSIEELRGVIGPLLWVEMRRRVSG